MGFAMLERVTASARHATFYLSCGDPQAVPIIFVHGWPELSISWRHQLPAFAALGFHAVAPDMRGYGRSKAYTRHEDYALEQVVADLIELLDSLGRDKAIWVGHDWGAPAVWSVAQHFPERCHAVANLCVPYIPNGFAPENIIPLSDRRVYPEDQFPAAQWDYQLYYQESFEAARQAFEADAGRTVRALFRAGEPADRGSPFVTAMIRALGGWFPGGEAPDLPRDPAVLSESDESAYVAALSRNGFFGPSSWYMNPGRNIEYAARAKDGGRLSMPVLFVHAENDMVCETVDSSLAEPMRAYCADLTEARVASGHWMAQEKPVEVNAALAGWLARKTPGLWPVALEPAAG